MIYITQHMYSKFVLWKKAVKDNGPLDTLHVDRIYMLVDRKARERIRYNSYAERFNTSLKRDGHFSV